MSVYAKPGTEGSVMSYESRYDNWIGGKWVPPVKGQYFENPSPVDGKTFCEVARSTAEDIDLALDAAWAEEEVRFGAMAPASPDAADCPQVQDMVARMRDIAEPLAERSH